MNIIRQSYLDILYNVKDNGMIKILTGVRRCGKSFLLEQYKDYLISNGVKNNQIVVINFEAFEFHNLYTSKAFYNYILQKTVDDKMYLLLDELSLVDGFASVLQTLAKKNHYDIYVSSSNTKIFSNEFKQAFDKKYQEIHILPFSFKDYEEVTKKEKKQAFNDFIKYGALPHVSKINDIDTNLDYIEGIFNSIIIKDLIEQKKVNDIDLLITIFKYLLDSIGSFLSLNQMALQISEKGKRVTPSTIEAYIQALQDSYIIYKASAFNIKSKLLIKGMDKYYISDFGFRIIKLGDKKFNMEYNLDNIVYLELVRRGYHVNIGKYDNNTVDFYAIKGKERIYYQVLETTSNKTILANKINTLKNIRDAYPKIILSLDDGVGTIDGIRRESVVDWLLK